MLLGTAFDILVDEHHHTVNQVDKISGQTLGKQFELLTMQFLQETFPRLQNLRPGRWTILQLGNNNKLKTSDFAHGTHSQCHLYRVPVMQGGSASVPQSPQQYVGDVLSCYESG